MTNITLQGNKIGLNGVLPVVGTVAPDFKAVKADLSEFSLSELKGKRIVLNVFPSLDTAVCANSVRKFNKDVASHPNTVVLCISKDLPFAHERFCSTEGLKDVVTLSTFRCDCFEKAYGLLITDGPLRGLLARAVIIIDENGTIVYEELVPEIVQEPNYEAVIASLK